MKALGSGKAASHSSFLSFYRIHCVCSKVNVMVSGRLSVEYWFHLANFSFLILLIYLLFSIKNRIRLTSYY